jgi:NAD+ kinase
MMYLSVQEEPLMRRIGVLYNPLSERSMRLSGELTSWMQDQGLDVWRGTSEGCREHPELLDEIGLLIALGGDGTVLRAARIAIPRQIPLLTVALGRLNFMSELGPKELPDALNTLLAGGGWYEERTLIDTTLYRRGEQRAEFTALNEVVLSRGDISRTLTVDVTIDDEPLTTYRADGVLLATATGSTAYALSAGGPIIDPRSRSLVLVPIAAHLTAVPSMVLHEDSVVKLTTRRQHTYHHVMLSADGHDNVLVQEDDEVYLRRSQNVCIFARVRPPAELYASFVQRLRRE